MRSLFGLLAATTLTFSTALPLLAAPGHDHAGHGGGDPPAAAYGHPGDAGKPARIVPIVMRENDGRMLFIPNRVEIAKGEQVQFVLRNIGELDHELVIGAASTNQAHAEEMALQPLMEHKDANARRLAAKQTGSLRWQFTQAGEFEYACLIPGHKEAGMTGRLIVR